ncbi:hypothetical protein CIG2463D_1487 [Campylobacter iguaniorum]|uniref:phage tail protein n=1 Tax=Campylobacter iguaniorum TaxID=1244531 RepID=UPI00073A1D00|nr:phage tail protein [Campylobacter iguaniorum]ALV25052.1 hypothetical protein CIG2463D_1487 [Campylobacter iguaniorum]
MVELKGLNKVLAKLNPDILKKATIRTLNDLGDKARTQITKEVRQSYNIKANEFKAFMKFKRASGSEMVYEIAVRGTRFNAMRFGAKKLKKKGKMSVYIKKETGRKVFKGPTFTAKNGAVLTRIGKTQDVKPVQTLSPAQMLTKEIVSNADKMVVDEFSKRLESNFDFYIYKV